jgi:hypothetical protein
MVPPNNHTRDFTSHPFIEAVRRDHTAPLQERFVRRRSLLKRLGLGVDALAGAAIVLG